MLFIAIFSFVIGQFIDITRHIKRFILANIVILMIFKVFIASYNDSSGEHFIRVRLSFEIFRMALFFACSVSLFNWFPRKYLIITNSLFDLNGVFALALSAVLALLFTMIYQNNTIDSVA